MSDTIRVLVVDDSAVYRMIVSKALEKIPGVELVGKAVNGKLAMEKIESLCPDLVTLDLEMPEMDGLEVLRALRDKKSSVRAVMLSALTDKGAKETIKALSLGAFDFLCKPTGDNQQENAAQIERELTEKVEAFRKYLRMHTSSAARKPPEPAKTAPPRPVLNATAQLNKLALGFGQRPQVVMIGISTGGPAALAKMLPGLPENLGIPVLIVQHMPPKFTKSLADSLNEKCALTICEAANGQTILPGHAYIAPGGAQMKIVAPNGPSECKIKITDDPPENSCKPSVDYLFRSAIEIFGARSLAVIMTGMGSDGSAACRLLKQKGGRLITQDEATCTVYGMPKEPAEQGLADVIAPLDDIADRIIEIVKGRAGGR